MIDRTTVVKGPGYVTYGGQTIFTAGDITLRLLKTQFAVESSLYGAIDQRVDDRRVEVTFTPIGEWTAGLIGVLFPYGNAVKGSGIFGASDSPLVIQGRDGRRVTVHNAALTSLPSLTLLTNANIFGECTFTGIRKNNTAWTDTAALFTEDANAWAAAAPTLANIKYVPYSVAWGMSSPWDAIKRDGGVQVTFEVDLTEESEDDSGIYQMTINEVGATATFTPIGVTAAQLLAAMDMQGSGNARGSSLIGGANDLVISGGTGNPVITLANANLVDSAEAIWSAQTKRIGAMNFRAMRSFDTSAPEPIFTVAVGGA